MNYPYFHIATSGMPVFGIFFGICLLMYGLVVKHKPFINASHYIFIFITILTVAVYWSGKQSLHLMVFFPDIDQEAVENHITTSGLALWSTVFLGLISIACLNIERFSRNRLKFLVNFSLLYALVVFGYLIYAGRLGGYIRHPEIGPEYYLKIEENNIE